MFLCHSFPLFSVGKCSQLHYNHVLVLVVVVVVVIWLTFFGVVLDIRQELQQLRNRLEKAMEGFLISGQVGAHNKLTARTRNEIANDDLFLSHELQQCKNWKNRPKKCPTFWA